MNLLFFFSVLFCAAFYIGKGYRLFCFYFSNKFFYYSCTIVFFFFFLSWWAWFFIP